MENKIFEFSIGDAVAADNEIEIWRKQRFRPVQSYYIKFYHYLPSIIEIPLDSQRANDLLIAYDMWETILERGSLRIAVLDRRTKKINRGKP